ncbi:MAG TPA: aromatic amino acid hydroxylase [Holophagaceae bacterium]|jgi:phenylalanine-4-hydroxylase|nr:aromatic amino acid hydroxylase [Holophagaceae bacterium]
MTPTERAIAKLPGHLRRFVVTQDYDAYTPRDQAVWRHILRRLTGHLKDRAHPVYLEGLAATGIGLDRIPSLDEMNEKLEALGWCAVAVRGFLPPAVFTELQTMKVLAIAEDIRDHSHIAYTPAPDIVHESAGHAPILANARYADYVQRCGQVGFKAIASLEDQEVFEAIRNLSVVKEDPTASVEDVKRAEERLHAASAAKRFTSENTKASRLYWWTAEYGLIGDLAAPKIYGAGILSSIGEAEHCLTDAVEKLPLSLACVDREYDITTMQPQLFVARDFDHLFEVLDQFEATLAWKRGGDFGLQQALESRTVNYLTLSDGTEITGTVTKLDMREEEHAPGLKTVAAHLRGPIQVSKNGEAMGAPVEGDAVVLFGDSALHAAHRLSDGLVFTSAALPSVGGGPADPEAWDQAFGEFNTFAAGDAEARARAAKAQALAPDMAALYADLRRERESGHPDPAVLARIAKAAIQHPGDWLLKAELDELRMPAHA